jgi:hypothetical protein
MLVISVAHHDSIINKIKQLEQKREVCITSLNYMEVAKRLTLCIS